MRSYSEYVQCSCGHYARIVWAEDRQHRDKVVCPFCGRVTVKDNPMGTRLDVKERADGGRE